MRLGATFSPIIEGRTCGPESSLSGYCMSSPAPTGISQRGEDVFTPLRSGHKSTESMGGRPAATEVTGGGSGEWRGRVQAETHDRTRSGHFVRGVDSCGGGTGYRKDARKQQQPPRSHPQDRIKLRTSLRRARRQTCACPGRRGAGSRPLRKRGRGCRPPIPAGKRGGGDELFNRVNATLSVKKQQVTPRRTEYLPPLSGSLDPAPSVRSSGAPLSDENTQRVSFPAQPLGTRVSQDQLDGKRSPDSHQPRARTVVVMLPMTSSRNPIIAACWRRQARALRGAPGHTCWIVELHAVSSSATKPYLEPQGGERRGAHPSLCPPLLQRPFTHLSNHASGTLRG